MTSFNNFVKERISTNQTQQLAIEIAVIFRWHTLALSVPRPVSSTRCFKIQAAFTILTLPVATTMDDQETSSAFAQVGWNFIVLMSRQGKIRLSEFFSSYAESEKRRILRDIAGDILPRVPKMCNIIEKGTYKFVYRRYASLYFVVGVPLGMNELIVLEQIHLFVEALDGYFNSGKSLFHGNASVRCFIFLIS